MVCEPSALQDLRFTLQTGSKQAASPLLTTPTHPHTCTHLHKLPPVGLLHAASLSRGPTPLTPFCKTLHLNISLRKTSSGRSHKSVQLLDHPKYTHTHRRSQAFESQQRRMTFSNSANHLQKVFSFLCLAPKARQSVHTTNRCTATAR